MSNQEAENPNELSGTRLRFGIMCNGLQFPAWEAECIRSLCQVAEPVLLLIDQGAEPERVGFFAKLKKLLFDPGMLWTLFLRRFGNRGSKALRKIDMTEELGGLEQREVVTINKGRFSRYFPEEDVAAVKKSRVDFIMRFAFGIVRGEVLKAPRHGVWSYHHDDIDKYRGGPPCFWEIYHNDDVTGATLQRITDRLDGGIILRQGWFRTAETSYCANRDNVYLGSSHWPAQVCRDLRNGEAAYVDAEPTKSDAPIYYRPTRFQLLFFFWRVVRNYVAAQLRPLFKADQWNVGTIEAKPESWLSSKSLSGIKWFPNRPRREFIADPFTSSDRDNEVLVEGYDYREQRGFVAAYDLDGNEVKDGGIHENHHLSYPVTVSVKDETYCLPECASQGELRWYRRNGSGWKPAGTLIDEPVLDATLLEHEGTWWMFGTKLNHYQDTSLFVWFADSPEGPWEPHPQNPVKSDVRSSRPAGRFFRHAGRLYRPAQDCGAGYGGAVRINRIERLDRNSFREVEVARITAEVNGPFPHGVHTLCVDEERAVVDGKRAVFIPQASWNYLRRRLSGRKRATN